MLCQGQVSFVFLFSLCWQIWHWSRSHCYSECSWCGFSRYASLFTSLASFSAKGIFNEVVSTISLSINLLLFLLTLFSFGIILCLHGRIFLFPRSSTDLESCRAAGSWNGWCEWRHSLLGWESFWWSKAVWHRERRFQVWHWWILRNKVRLFWRLVAIFRKHNPNILQKTAVVLKAFWTRKMSWMQLLPSLKISNPVLYWDVLTTWCATCFYMFSVLHEYVVLQQCDHSAHYLWKGVGKKCTFIILRSPSLVGRTWRLLHYGNRSPSVSRGKQTTFFYCLCLCRMGEANCL